MKLQNVILKGIAKKITWIEAAEIAGLSIQTMGYIRERYATYGYDGLYEQRGRKRYIHRVPLPIAETVLALYQQRYSGADVRRFHQTLRSKHGIQLSYNWVKQAVEGAGLVSASNLVSRRRLGPAALSPLADLRQTRPIQDRRNGVSHLAHD